MGFFISWQGFHHFLFSWQLKYSSPWLSGVVQIFLQVGNNNTQVPWLSLHYLYEFDLVSMVGQRHKVIENQYAIRGEVGKWLGYKFYINSLSLQELIRIGCNWTILLFLFTQALFVPSWEPPDSRFPCFMELSEQLSGNGQILYFYTVQLYAKVLSIG